MLIEIKGSKLINSYETLSPLWLWQDNSWFTIIQYDKPSCLGQTHLQDTCLDKRLRILLLVLRCTNNGAKLISICGQFEAQLRHWQSVRSVGLVILTLSHRLCCVFRFSMRGACFLRIANSSLIYLIQFHDMSNFLKQLIFYKSKSPPC